MGLISSEPTIGVCYKKKNDINIDNTRKQPNHEQVEINKSKDI